MLRIMLPCYLFKEQLESKLALLRQIAESQILNRLPQKCAIGMEIGTDMSSFLEPTFFARSKQLLDAADMPKDLYLSLHGPQFMVAPNHPFNFFNGKTGFEHLIRAINFADLIGADLVNIHAHQGLSSQQLNAINQDGRTNLRRTHLRNVRDALAKLRDKTGLTPILCIENVPYNFHGDQQLDPKMGLYELAFVDPADYHEVISPKTNTFACIDVCHLAQVYDSSELLEKIKPLGTGVRHVHLSDVEGSWFPYVSVCREGRIPGTGRIGKRVFQELLRHILALSEQVDINLVLEINDSDWVAIKETKQGMEVLLDMLRHIGMEQRINTP